MMKASFSTLACPDWGLSEILGAAAKYGYDGVELRAVSRELDLWKLPEFRPSSLATTHTMVEDYGLVVAAVGTSACFHSPNARERERNMTSALYMGEIAAGLGAPAIRVFGDRIQSGSDRGRTVAWIAEALVELADKLRPNNVQVWLETHGDFAKAADVSQILAGVNNEQVGIIWDPANAFQSDGEAPLITPLMSSRLRHVHLKDLRRDAQGSAGYVLTGEGAFPFEKMFKSLAGISFDGFVSFEWEKLWHPELVVPEVALPHFINWWKKQEKARG